MHAFWQGPSPTLAVARTCGGRTLRLASFEHRVQDPLGVLPAAVVLQCPAAGEQLPETGPGRESAGNQVPPLHDVPGGLVHHFQFSSPVQEALAGGEVAEQGSPAWYRQAK